MRMSDFAKLVLGLILLGGLNQVVAEASDQSSLTGKKGKEASAETGQPVTREQLEKQLRTLQESLILANAESELFRQQWQELRLRNEALGIEALTADEKKLQEKVVQGFKQAYQAERDRRNLTKLLEQLLRTSETLVKAGPEGTGTPQAEFEAAAKAARDFLSGQREGAISPGQDLSNGQLVHLNAELGVVVINLGKAQGVQPGMPFRVLQGDLVVGRLKAYQVREQLSAALVEKVEEGRQLKVGDRVAVAAEK
jgi:hypothetical protein